MEPNSKPEEKKQERSYKEQRVRELTFAYYSMPAVKKAIFEFSKNRECVPRYYEGFGKRPDSFQYESDILEHVSRGATSFHCSEELWKDPLEISTEMSRKEFDESRIGWDMLIDVDSPYLEYSKIYARLIVNALKKHNVKNFQVKFSGSKGFHIIIPWQAFPKEIYNQKTKDMFPEWPRIICEYLSEIIQPMLADEILEDQSLKQLAEKTGKKEQDLVINECKSCHRPAVKKFLIQWSCPFCKNEITTHEGLYNSRRKPKCPDCRKDLEEKLKKEFLACEFCRINSIKNPGLFEEKERVATEKIIDADLVLVAPRHLFRMPYSLHEKTALSSVVIDKDKIKDFDISHAKPFKVKIQDFYPKAEKEEAKTLLLKALDWNEQKQRSDNMIQDKKPVFENQKKPGDFKKIQIENPSENILPPCIRLISKGMEQDGKKRALFVLINFFKSLGVPEVELEKRIYEWNNKNSPQLRKGYIQAQLAWFSRNTSKMPPNCANAMYKDIGVCKPDDLCRQIKNPVNYAMKKYFRKG